MLDAFRRDCDTAVVVTNDSDLQEPIEIAQEELGLRVGVINPQKPGYRSRRLLNVTFFKQLRPAALRKAQFPAVLHYAHGTAQRLDVRRARSFYGGEPPHRFYSNHSLDEMEERLREALLVLRSSAALHQSIEENIRQLNVLLSRKLLQQMSPPVATHIMQLEIVFNYWRSALDRERALADVVSVQDRDNHYSRPDHRAWERQKAASWRHTAQVLQLAGATLLMLEDSVLKNDGR